MDRDPLAPLHAFLAAHPLQRRTIDGLEWSYLAAGAGAAQLLLLPGAMGFAETAFHYLQAFAPTCRVVSLDFPPAVVTARGLVAGIAQLAAAEGGGPTYVVGGSYGGLAAQALAAQQPDRVDALLLSNTGALNAWLAAPYRLLGAAAAALPPPAVQRLIALSLRRFLPADTPEQDFWRAYFLWAAPRYTRPVVAGRFRLLADLHRQAAPAAAALRGWARPVLIVDTPGDRMIAARDRQQLARLFPLAAQVKLARRGHAATLDATDEYVAVYRQFLAGLPGCSVRAAEPVSLAPAHADACRWSET